MVTFCSSCYAAETLHSWWRVLFGFMYCTAIEHRANIRHLNDQHLTFGWRSVFGGSEGRSVDPTFGFGPWRVRQASRLRGLVPLEGALCSSAALRCFDSKTLYWGGVLKTQSNPDLLTFWFCHVGPFVVIAPKGDHL